MPKPLSIIRAYINFHACSSRAQYLKFHHRISKNGKTLERGNDQAIPWAFDFKFFFTVLPSTWKCNLERDFVIEATKRKLTARGSNQFFSHVGKLLNYFSTIGSRLAV